MSNSATLEISTTTDTNIVITRLFNAPRRLVWDAMSKPEFLKRWLFGPPGWEMTVCEEDQRVGGKFRWAWRGPEGAEMSMSGVYNEVTPPERMVRTESFETGCEGGSGQQLSTMVLTEDGGQTRLTLTVSYPTKEARDISLASGMEKGISAGYDRLDELFAVGEIA